MYTTLKELAKELGLDRSNMRKYVLAKGFAPVKIRTPESKGQLTLALTDEDAETVRELREKEGFSRQIAINDNDGWFYIIQTVPDFSPNRIKLGFAGDVQRRLKAHQTSAPTAKVVKAWPCKRSWEKAAMDCATQENCNLVANEVFDCSNVEEILISCDEFFKVMPRWQHH